MLGQGLPGLHSKFKGSLAYGLGQSKKTKEENSRLKVGLEPVKVLRQWKYIACESLEPINSQVDDREMIFKKMYN